MSITIILIKRNTFRKTEKTIPAIVKNSPRNSFLDCQPKEQT